MSCEPNLSCREAGLSCLMEVESPETVDRAPLMEPGLKLGMECCVLNKSSEGPGFLREASCLRRLNLSFIRLLPFRPTLSILLTLDPFKGDFSRLGIESMPHATRSQMMPHSPNAGIFFGAATFQSCIGLHKPSAGCSSAHGLLRRKRNAGKESVLKLFPMLVWGLGVVLCYPSCFVLYVLSEKGVKSILQPRFKSSSRVCLYLCIRPNLISSLSSMDSNDNLLALTAMQTLPWKDKVKRCDASYSSSRESLASKKAWLNG